MGLALPANWSISRQARGSPNSGAICTSSHELGVAEVSASASTLGWICRLVLIGVEVRHVVERLLSSNPGVAPLRKSST
jgi:hypothetical protein